MQHVGQAVDKVRRQENRELLRQEDERLKGTKYIWLYREENLPDKHRPTLEALKATNLKVAMTLEKTLEITVAWYKRQAAGISPAALRAYSLEQIDAYESLRARCSTED